MADLLFGKAPYFKTRKGKIEWQQIAQSHGLQELVEIDHTKQISPEAIEKYRKFSPTPLQTHYEHHHELTEFDDHQYAEAFELLEDLLKIDYKKRPMASEAL